MRAIELYLKSGGRFAFVMPHGILRGQPHSTFRSGVWHGPSFNLTASFREAWDLSKAATGFPMTSSVLSGDLTPNVSAAIPLQVEKWVTRGSKSNVSWPAMEPRTLVSQATVVPTAQADAGPRPLYKNRFRQGAVLAPRVIFFINEVAAGPMGAGSGRVAVESSRSSAEDVLWADTPSLAGIVEKAFVRPLLLGATVLSFGLLGPTKTVLPIKPDGTRLLTQPEIESHPGLSDWWSKASAVWDAGKSESDTGTLADRAKYIAQLAAQLPPASHRVVYTASGNRIAAARPSSETAIVEHKLYWAAAASEAEAKYLIAMLNSDLVLDRLKPFQNVGLFGPRDINKNVFRAVIRVFDLANVRHLDLAKLATEAESRVVEMELGDTQFQLARKAIREDLQSSGLQAQIEIVVGDLVPAAIV